MVLLHLKIVFVNLKNVCLHLKMVLLHLKMVLLHLKKCVVTSKNSFFTSKKYVFLMGHLTLMVIKWCFLKSKKHLKTQFKIHNLTIDYPLVLAN